MPRKNERKTKSQRVFFANILFLRYSLNFSTSLRIYLTIFQQKKRIAWNICLVLFFTIISIMAAFSTMPKTIYYKLHKIGVLRIYLFSFALSFVSLSLLQWNENTHTSLYEFRFFTSKLRPSNRFLLLNYMLPLSLSVFRFSYHLLEAFPCEIIEDVLRQQWESNAIQGNLPTLHKQSSISCNSHYSQKGKFHRVSKIVQIDRQLFSNVYLFVLSLISFQCDSMIYMNALSPDSEKLI